jgi:hypothetical protein
MRVRSHVVCENANEVLILRDPTTSTFALARSKRTSTCCHWYCVAPTDMVDCYETQANGGGSHSVDPRASMYNKLLQEGGSCASSDLPIDWASGCPATDTINQSITQSDTSCCNSLAGSSEGDWDAGNEVSCDGSLHSATDAGIPSDGDW